MKNAKKITLGIAASAALLFGIAGVSFAQTSTPMQSYDQGVATWQYQQTVKCYRLFYKETGAANWQHSVHCRDLKNPVWQYTIKYLKPNTSYTYDVQVVGYDNKTWWLGEQKLTNITPQQ